MCIRDSSTVGRGWANRQCKWKIKPKVDFPKKFFPFFYFDFSLIDERFSLKNPFNALNLDELKLSMFKILNIKNYAILLYLKYSKSMEYS